LQQHESCSSLECHSPLDVFHAGTIKHKWLWRGFAAGFAVLTLSIGFLAGFYTAKNVGTDYLTGCYKHKAGQPAPEESVQLTQYSRGMPLPGYELRELPAPWSQEAVRIQANPGSAGETYQQLRLWLMPCAGHLQLAHWQLHVECPSKLHASSIKLLHGSLYGSALSHQTTAPTAA
jgi:hypothetical protein